MNTLSKIKNNFLKIKTNFVSSEFQWLNYRYVRIYLVVCSIFNLISWAFAIFIKNGIKEGLAILHYSVDFGPDLLGSPSTMLIIPLFGLVIIVLNSMLLLAFSKFDKFELVAHLLLFVASLVNFLLIVALFFIYLFNFKS